MTYIIVLAVIFFAFILCVMYSGPSHGDDTFIYMNYVKHALNDHGFVFNIGEKSFGVTSSLWPLFMTPVAHVFGNKIEVWKTTSALLFSVGSGLFFILLAEKLEFKRAILLTTSLILAPLTLRWSGSGMENGLTLFILISSIIFAFTIQNRCAQVKWHEVAGAGILYSLLPFCRPELTVLSILFSILGVYTLNRNTGTQKQGFILVFTYCTTLTLLLALCVNFFGGIVPQTALAKAISTAQADKFYAFKEMLMILFVTGFFAFSVIFLIFFTNFYRPQMPVLILILQSLTVFLYMLTKNQLVSTRYDTHFALPLLLASLLYLADNLERAQSRIFNIGWILMLVAQFTIDIIVLFYFFPVTRVSEAATNAPFFEKFNMLTSGEARIAMVEVGTFGFYTTAYIIDLYGLTDQKTLHFLANYGPRKAEGEDFGLPPLAGLGELLRYRKATHLLVYNHSCNQPRLNGVKLQLFLQGEGVRNNFTGGMISRPHFCIFKTSFE